MSATQLRGAVGKQAETGSAVERGEPVLRPEGIGGSDAAAAIGVNPYCSQVEKWAELTGKIEREPSEAMRWGTLLEPVVYAELEARGFELMPAPADGFADGYRFCHPDGFASDLYLGRNVLTPERGILEIKTAGPWASQGWQDGATPAPYLVQCLHNMELTGDDYALLACLVGGQRLEVRVVERDERLIGTMLDLEEEFWRYVQTDTMPPPDGTDSSKNALILLHPTATRGEAIHLSMEGWQAVKTMRARAEQLAAIQAQHDEAKQAVMAEMGAAELAISPLDTECVRWGNVTSTRLDVTRLKAERPDVYEQFAKTTTTRRFTVE